jgi:hypothetical protein
MSTGAERGYLEDLARRRIGRGHGSDSSRVKSVRRYLRTPNVRR